MLSPQQWHHRFQQQAGWTAWIRRHLIERVQLPPNARVLEFGCGTGAITRELAAGSPLRTFGFDIRLDYLQLARRQDPNTRYLQADAYHPPLSPAACDAVICHMFLLWIADPARVLGEMARCVRPGGWVMALAEPDYAGRIDHPRELGALGRWQAESLRKQGAYPDRGRELAGLFSGAGLHHVETGVLGGQWRSADALAGFEQEWQVLLSDLEGEIPADTLNQLRQLDHTARKTGERILFVPTFYAIGQVV